MYGWSAGSALRQISSASRESGSASGHSFLLLHWSCQLVQPLAVERVGVDQLDLAEYHRGLFLQARRDVGVDGGQGLAQDLQRLTVQRLGLGQLVLAAQ